MAQRRGVPRRGRGPAPPGLPSLQDPFSPPVFLFFDLDQKSTPVGAAAPPACSPGLPLGGMAPRPGGGPRLAAALLAAAAGGAAAQVCPAATDVPNPYSGEQHLRLGHWPAGLGGWSGRGGLGRETRIFPNRETGRGTPGPPPRGPRPVSESRLSDGWGRRCEGLLLTLALRRPSRARRMPRHPVPVRRVRHGRIHLRPRRLPRRRGSRSGRLRNLQGAAGQGRHVPRRVRGGPAGGSGRRAVRPEH